MDWISVVRKYIQLIGTSLFLSSSLALASNGTTWESFGDWEVAKISDTMDPVTKVLIRTNFERTTRASTEDGYVIGFRIVGKSIMRLYSMVNLGVDEYWPECGFNNASYSVGGSKAQYIASIDNPGDCNLVPMNGELIRKFKTGQTAKLRIDGVDGDVSLRGFPEAWTRAMKLAR
jgi:hypothetical protein